MSSYSRKFERKLKIKKTRSVQGNVSRSCVVSKKVPMQLIGITKKLVGRVLFSSLFPCLSSQSAQNERTNQHTTPAVGENKKKTITAWSWLSWLQSCVAAFVYTQLRAHFITDRRCTRCSGEVALAIHLSFPLFFILPVMFLDGLEKVDNSHFVLLLMNTSLFSLSCLFIFSRPWPFQLQYARYLNAWQHQRYLWFLNWFSWNFEWAIFNFDEIITHGGNVASDVNMGRVLQSKLSEYMSHFLWAM